MEPDRLLFKETAPRWSAHPMESLYLAEKTMITMMTIDKA